MPNGNGISSWADTTGTTPGKGFFFCVVCWRAATYSTFALSGETSNRPTRRDRAGSDHHHPRVWWVGERRGFSSVRLWCGFAPPPRRSILAKKEKKKKEESKPRNKGSSSSTCSIWNILCLCVCVCVLPFQWAGRKVFRIVQRVRMCVCVCVVYLCVKRKFVQANLLIPATICGAPHTGRVAFFGLIQLVVHCTVLVCPVPLWEGKTGKCLLGRKKCVFVVAAFRDVHTEHGCSVSRI